MEGKRGAAEEEDNEGEEEGIGEAVVVVVVGVEVALQKVVVLGGDKGGEGGSA